MGLQETDVGHEWKGDATVHYLFSTKNWRHCQQATRKLIQIGGVRVLKAIYDTWNITISPIYLAKYLTEYLEVC